MAARRDKIYLRVLINILRVELNIFQHEKIKLMFPSDHMIFFYYIKYSQYLTTFVAIFRRFPTTFRKCPKIFKLVQAKRTFPNISGHLPRITVHSLINHCWKGKKNNASSNSVLKNVRLYFTQLYRCTCNL